MPLARTQANQENNPNVANSWVQIPEHSSRSGANSCAANEVGKGKKGKNGSAEEKGTKSGKKEERKEKACPPKERREKEKEAKIGANMHPIQRKRTRNGGNVPQTAI